MCSKWDCFILRFRFLLCCGCVTRRWRKTERVSPSSIPQETDLVQNRKRRCGISDHCHQHQCCPTIGKYPNDQCQESGHPHFSFLSSGFEAYTVSWKLLFLLHLSPWWQVKGVLLAVRRCCGVSGADVSKGFFRGKLLALATLLHHWAEGSRKVSSEDVLWHLLFRLRGICRGEVSIILTD